MKSFQCRVINRLSFTNNVENILIDVEKQSYKKQCCGSGSGSVGSFCHQAKIVRKVYLDSYCFATSLWLFIFENNVNITSKSSKQKIIFLLPSWRSLTKIAERSLTKIAGSGSLVRGTDPRIQIRTNISRIRNTATKQKKSMSPERKSFNK